MVSETQKSPESEARGDSDEYVTAFRKKVFRLMVLGYELLDAKDYIAAEEPVITGELVAAINAITNDSSRPRWVAHFVAHDDPQINAPGRVGKRRKKVDIELILTRRGPNRHYYFEAKRLVRGKCTTGRYLGKSGVGEFVAGNYAFGEDEGGMVGYMQSDEHDYWANGLARHVGKSKKQLCLSSDGEWARADTDCGHEGVYRTIHERNSVGRKITLYHLLLHFC